MPKCKIFYLHATAQRNFLVFVGAVAELNSASTDSCWRGIEDLACGDRFNANLALILYPSILHVRIQEICRICQMLNLGALGVVWKYPTSDGLPGVL
jgi:hypothetical protein